MVVLGTFWFAVRMDFNWFFAVFMVDFWNHGILHQDDLKKSILFFKSMIHFFLEVNQYCNCTYLKNNHKKSEKLIFNFPATRKPNIYQYFTKSLVLTINKNSFPKSLHKTTILRGNIFGSLYEKKNPWLYLYTFCWWAYIVIICCFCILLMKSKQKNPESKMEYNWFLGHVWIIFFRID